MKMVAKTRRRGVGVGFKRQWGIPDGVSVFFIFIFELAKKLLRRVVVVVVRWSSTSGGFQLNEEAGASNRRWMLSLSRLQAERGALVGLLEEEGVLARVIGLARPVLWVLLGVRGDVGLNQQTDC